MAFGFRNLKSHISIKEKMVKRPVEGVYINHVSRPLKFDESLQTIICVLLSDYVYVVDCNNSFR